MKLSRRERAVLVRMPFYTNREIGTQLSIGYNEIKNKVSAIYRKLGVPDLPDPDDKRIYAVVIGLKLDEIAIADLAMTSEKGG